MGAPLSLAERLLSRIVPLRAGEGRELPAAVGVDEAFLEVDAATRVGPFEEDLDFGEEGFHGIFEEQKFPGLPGF